MKINDGGSPLKVVRLKRISGNFTQENQYLSVCQNVNQKHQIMAQNIIEKIRCNSENLQSRQKRPTISYAEQLAQLSLKNIMQQQIYVQKNNINTEELSPAKLNDSLTKKNNKRVIISALKLQTESAKNFEEEFENKFECETIVNEEFKKYRDLRTDSFSYNDHLVKEQVIKQLQEIGTKKSGSLSPLRRQSNTLNTLQGQREIKQLQASRQLKEYISQQLCQSQLQDDNSQDIQKIDRLNQKQSPQFIQRCSFQKALTDLEEEIGQLNVNCRKRYERSRISQNSINLQDTLISNTKSQNSEEDIDNRDALVRYEQLSQINQKQKISEKEDTSCNTQNQENNQIDDYELKIESKEKYSPLWRIKMNYSQKNQMNNTKANSDLQQYQMQKEIECSGNFAIFKNQFLKQMQSNVYEKKNFTTSDSSYYLGDADTDSPKQSSALSTKKNSCESEEIISANKEKQDPFNNNNISLIFSQSQELVDQQQIQKKQYCVQQLQDQLNFSQQNQTNSKNYSNPSFQFGFNGFLSQQIYEREEKKDQKEEKNKNQLRGRSLTPFQSSKLYTLDQNKIKQSNQFQEINQADQIGSELNEPQNQHTNQDKIIKIVLSQKNTQQQQLTGNKNQFSQVKQKQATLEQIVMNDPVKKAESSILRQRKRNLSAKEKTSYTQPNEGSSDLNEFRKKLLNRVMKSNIEKQSQSQKQIGDNNNGIFQIRRLANKKSGNNYEYQQNSLINNFINNNYFQQTQQNMKLNVLNIENNELKQKSDNKNISTNIQANQEKLNNILKKKYKHINNKSNKNGGENLQNQILQECHQKIFSAEDDVSFYLKKLGTSPAVNKMNEKVSNNFDLNKSALI